MTSENKPPLHQAMDTLYWVGRRWHDGSYDAPEKLKEARAAIIAHVAGIEAERNEAWEHSSAGWCSAEEMKAERDAAIAERDAAVLNRNYYADERRKTEAERDAARKRTTTEQMIDQGLIQEANRLNITVDELRQRLIGPRELADG